MAVSGPLAHPGTGLDEDVFDRGGFRYFGLRRRVATTGWSRSSLALRNTTAARIHWPPACRDASAAERRVRRSADRWSPTVDTVRQPRTSTVSSATETSIAAEVMLRSNGIPPM